MQNKTVETIELSKFVKTPNRSEFLRSQPFCICFIYAKEGNFIVKGMERQVTTYIAQRFPFCYYHYTFWKDGKSRGHWTAPSRFGLYFSRKKIRERYVYVLSMNTKEGFQSDMMYFRNMPKNWLPVFDKAIYKGN